MWLCLEIGPLRKYLNWRRSKEWGLIREGSDSKIHPSLPLFIFLSTYEDTGKMMTIHLETREEKLILMALWSWTPSLQEL